MRLHPTPSHLLLQEDQSRLQGTFRRLAPKTFLDTSCTDLLSWHCTPPPAQLCQRCPVGRSPHRPPHVSCTDCPWPSNTTLKIVAQQPHRGSTTLTPCANCNHRGRKGDFVRALHNFAPLFNFFNFAPFSTTGCPPLQTLCDLHIHSIVLL